MTNDLIIRNELLEKSMPAREFARNVPDLHVVSVNSVRRAPAVDAEPVVHGRWIHCAGKSNLWHYSECGGRIMYNQTRKTYNIKKLPVSEANKFCKHCGAKMDGGS